MGARFWIVGAQCVGPSFELLGLSGGGPVFYFWGSVAGARFWIVGAQWLIGGAVSYIVGDGARPNISEVDAPALNMVRAVEAS